MTTQFVSLDTFQIVTFGLMNSQKTNGYTKFFEDSAIVEATKGGNHK